MLCESELSILTEQVLSHAGVLQGLEPILKGGSDRRYYRLRFMGGKLETAILMTYTNARPDNLKFVQATQHLIKIGVRVPQIYHHDEQRMLIWMEDLGEIDLGSFNDAEWSERKAFYVKTLEAISQLHRVSEAELSAAVLKSFEPAFDDALYQWEQDYFREHLLQGVKGIDTLPMEIEQILLQLRHTILQEKRAPVHRDFQSQNVMILAGEACLIDYQGLRLGVPAYDVASLLWDPYVDFTDEQRAELIAAYVAMNQLDAQAFQRVFLRCSCQRLMQALGAYGNLSRNLGKPQFAQHIPEALSRLQWVCAADAELEPLGKWLESL